MFHNEYLLVVFFSVKIICRALGTPNIVGKYHSIKTSGHNTRVIACTASVMSPKVVTDFVLKNTFE